MNLFTQKLSVFLLAFALLLPNPAYALRTESNAESGLEEKLRLALLDQRDPGQAVLSTIVRPIADTFGLSAPQSSPAPSARPELSRRTGLEERGFKGWWSRHKETLVTAAILLGIAGGAAAYYFQDEIAEQYYLQFNPPMPEQATMTPSGLYVQFPPEMKGMFAVAYLQTDLYYPQVISEINEKGRAGFHIEVQPPNRPGWVKAMDRQIVVFPSSEGAEAAFGEGEVRDPSIFRNFGAAAILTISSEGKVDLQRFPPRAGLEETDVVLWQGKFDDLSDELKARVPEWKRDGIQTLEIKFPEAVPLEFSRAVPNWLRDLSLRGSIIALAKNSQKTDELVGVILREIGQFIDLGAPRGITYQLIDQRKGAITLLNPRGVQRILVVATLPPSVRPELVEEPEAGLEESTGISRRVLVIGAEEDSVAQLAEVVRRLRPDLEVVTAIVPRENDVVASSIENPAQRAGTFLIAGGESAPFNNSVLSVMQEIEFVKMVERMHIPKEPYEDAPIGQVLAKDIPTAGVEELDSDVLDLLRAFQAETNEQKRLKDLEIGLKNFRPAQRSQFLSALSWLPDEQKVSDLLAVVLSGDSSSAGKVRAQFMKMIRENWTNPAANPETVLRILLGRMSWDKSAEIARDFMRIVIRELISTGATDPALPGVVGIAAAESTIRNFREQAQLNSRDFYHRLALAHELIADAYGKIAALGPNRQEIEQSQRVEQAYLFLYEAIAQTILAEGPNARAILRLIGQGNGHASYEFAKQILEPLILSQDPHERLMALSRLAELEQTYADLLMLTRRIEFQPSEHYVRAVQFREQHKTLILERRQVLGLAPSTGLEEGDSSKDRLKSSQISFNGLIAAAREHGIEAFEIYKDRDDPRPATLAAKMAGNPLTDPDAVRGLEFEMRRIFGDEVDRQTYYLRIGAKEGWDGIWAEVVANAGLEEEWDRRVSDYYQGASVAVLGGRGFVGSRYLQQLLSQWAGVVGEVKAITTQELQRFRDQVEDLPGLSKLTLVRGNHLDLTDVRELIRGAKVVMDTAGLAWQHLPGGRPAALTDELLQNGISAVLIGQALGRDQRLVWSSSNAGDYMFARLSEGDARALSVEIDHRARRYVNWVRSLGERVPTRDKLTSFVEQDLHALPPGKFSKGPANPEEVAYAEQSSYAYSKLLGERILEIIGREDGKDIRVLKISDVYGPGQGLGPPIWDARQSPRQAARRIQRFMAVYEAIRAQGYQPWQLTAAGHADGFSEADGQIQQKIFDDSVAPTYIDDVVQMMHRAAAADLPAGKVVLSVSGPWISNAEMVKTIADVVGLEKDLGRTVRFVNGPPILAKQPNPADGDLGLLGMKDILTPFEEGIGRHLAWWRAQSAGVEELPVTPAIFAGMMDHTNLTWGADKAAIEPSAGGLEEKAEGGLLEIPSVVEAKKVLILAPEALRMLGALAWLQPADGQPIPLVALAENADQAGEIRRWASDLGLNAEVIDVSAAPYEGNVPQALQMISRYYASENGLIPLVVRDLEALLEVAKFLGVAEPESFARMAEAAISEQVGQYL